MALFLFQRVTPGVQRNFCKFHNEIRSLFEFIHKKTALSVKNYVIRNNSKRFELPLCICDKIRAIVFNINLH
ncbi:MAG: hypothetical protein D6714_12220, partial [Bacteroidetes bacterium]